MRVKYVSTAELCQHLRGERVPTACHPWATPDEPCVCERRRRIHWVSEGISGSLDPMDPLGRKVLRMDEGAHGVQVMDGIIDGLGQWTPQGRDRGERIEDFLGVFFAVPKNEIRMELANEVDIHLLCTAHSLDVGQLLCGMHTIPGDTDKSVGQPEGAEGLRGARN